MPLVIAARQPRCPATTRDESRGTRAFAIRPIRRRSRRSWQSCARRSRGAVLVRRGKGGRRREVGMDQWAWDQLQPWLEIRASLPVGALLCVIHGATAGRHWEPSAARKQLRRTAARAGVRRRFAPHQLRHAHAVEMAHEGVPLVVIQRQLGHANLGVTSIYLQGIDSSEIIDTVHSRPAPVISATPGLIRR